MLYEEYTYLFKMSSVKLTKVISKKKDALFQFSDKLRRYNVKGKNLTGSLPIEKALAIFRETESNVVRLQIYFKDQSFARPSMLPIIS